MSKSVSSQHKVLVTGATGFLGAEIIRQAAVTGIQVRAASRSADSPFPGIDHCCIDLLDPTSLKFALEGVESVIHAAGLAHIFDTSPAIVAPFHAVNVTGTAHVAQAAAQAGVRHFILISSVAVYGSSLAARDEDMICRPDGPYAESKWQAEQQAIDIATAAGMGLTILRLATLYGEGDPGNVARLMRAIDSGRFVWIGDGSNRKSLLHREDAARACLAVLCRLHAGISIYNVSAPPCTMCEVVEGLAAALGRRLPRWRVPASLALGVTGAAARLGQGRGRLGTLPTTVQKWLADDVYETRKFQQTFGYQSHVELSDGLQREVAWYRGHPLREASQCNRF